MKFVNDPKFDVVPPVGGDVAPVLLARRTQAGEALLWEPGVSDPEALLAFVGDGTLVSLAGEVYQRMPDRSLTPWPLGSKRCVVVKPPAGEVQFIWQEDVLKAEWAMVQLSGIDGWVRAEVQRPAVDNGSFAVVDGEVSNVQEDTGVLGAIERALEPVGADYEQPAAVAPVGDESTGAAPGENQPADKRKPGRPPGSKNKPKVEVSSG